MTVSIEPSVPTHLVLNSCKYGRKSFVWHQIIDFSCTIKTVQQFICMHPSYEKYYIEALYIKG